MRKTNLKKTKTLTKMTNKQDKNNKRHTTQKQNTKHK